MHHDLATLHWTLSGFHPCVWRHSWGIHVGDAATAEIRRIPARVPGSVQGALRAAGLLPDWNVGLQAQACEWVENREWVFETELPAEWIVPGQALRLVCDGLDGTCTVLFDGHDIGTVANAFMPQVLDFGPALAAGAGVKTRILRLAFHVAPRWLGQIHRTSQVTAFKPRFNYHWDWTPRLVQIGVWDGLRLEAVPAAQFARLAVRGDAEPVSRLGALSVHGVVSGAAERVSVTLSHGGTILRHDGCTVAAFNADGLTWGALSVELWWPNGAGAQPLYEVRVALLDAAGRELAVEHRQVGFRHIAWAANPGARAGADPWLCVVNGTPLFLQGVNWTPVRPHFADVTPDETAARVRQYAALVCNVLRVWGGAVLEKADFYAECDARGLLVWQELPLSSSGIDNVPPDDPAFIAEMGAIAASYVARRGHHACLLAWSGGNELTDAKGVPVDARHPLIGAMAAIFTELDPGRRFMASSPTGPRFYAKPEHLGDGDNWDVHGPWKLIEGTEDANAAYWARDDALFRSEVGVAGASPVDLIRAHAGDQACTPIAPDAPLWVRTHMWVEIDAYRAAGGSADDLEGYVVWSQSRQARGLAVAARASKARFPACGGFIVWMGHDSFPVTANLSVLDFLGRPKPAALALAEVFHAPAGTLAETLARTAAVAG